MGMWSSFRGFTTRSEAWTGTRDKFNITTPQGFRKQGSLGVLYIVGAFCSNYLSEPSAPAGCRNQAESSRFIFRKERMNRVTVVHTAMVSAMGSATNTANTLFSKRLGRM